jgi:hypothetical protein
MLKNILILRHVDPFSLNLRHELSLVSELSFSYVLDDRTVLHLVTCYGPSCQLEALYSVRAMQTVRCLESSLEVAFFNHSPTYVVILQKEISALHFVAWQLVNSQSDHRSTLRQ